jgi:hypothetical protein
LYWIFVIHQFYHQIQIHLFSNKSIFCFSQCLLTTMILNFDHHSLSEVNSKMKLHKKVIQWTYFRLFLSLSMQRLQCATSFIRIWNFGSAYKAIRFSENLEIVLKMIGKVFYELAPKHLKMKLKFIVNFLTRI